MNLNMINLHARRILSHSSKARLFCSNTNRTIWASNQTLQSRIDSALHQNSKISTVLEQWRQQGNKLNPSFVRGIFEKLRDSKQYPQALEVSTWMAEKKICSLVPEDYTARFDLIKNVLGVEEAGKFLEKVPENLRNESMHTALLKSYAGKKDVDRAEDVFKKMRELGLLLKPSPYSSMTSLYSSIGNEGKVDEILREMKENDVEEQSSGGTESDASEEGGETIGEECMKTIVGVVAFIVGVVVFTCFVFLPLFMLLHAAATDPNPLDTLVLLLLCATFCPYLLLFFLFNSPPTDSQ